MIKDMTKKLNALAWALSFIVSLVAFAVWASSYNWAFSSMNAYTWFPLFGLLAFSLMWGHYIVATARKYLGISREAVSSYFEITSSLVLSALLLHPGLFIVQLYLDGQGLPPESYKSYVPQALVWVVVLGTISWLVFMFYELRRKFSGRSWWKYVGYANDTAMLAIFYHGLQLGSHLNSGWFVWLWYFYGVSLVLAIVYLKFYPEPESRSK